MGDREDDTIIDVTEISYCALGSSVVGAVIQERHKRTAVGYRGGYFSREHFAV